MFADTLECRIVGSGLYDNVQDALHDVSAVDEAERLSPALVILRKGVSLGGLEEILHNFDWIVTGSGKPVHHGPESGCIVIRADYIGKAEVNKVELAAFRLNSVQELLASQFILVTKC